MAIIRKTDLGEVKVTDQVVAGIISDIMTDPDMSDRIWPATEHGHRIGKKKWIAEIIDLGDSDLASNIDVSSDDSGNVTIEFSVIVKFGLSINIAGVKSRQIAKRSTCTIYKYSSE